MFKVPYLANRGLQRSSRLRALPVKVPLHSSSMGALWSWKEATKVTRCTKGPHNTAWVLTGSPPAAYQSIYLSVGWTVLGSNPIGGKIFRTHPDWPCGPPSIIYKGCHCFFPGGKSAGVWCWPPLSRTEVKERIELYTYSPSGSSRPVLGWTLAFNSRNV
jgi:hypothetical protein